MRVSVRLWGQDQIRLKHDETAAGCDHTAHCVGRARVCVEVSECVCVCVVCVLEGRVGAEVSHGMACSCLFGSSG